MNERDAMSRYLKPSAKLKLLEIVSAILFISTAAGAIISATPQLPGAAQMQKSSEAGKYYYIDVQCMSTKMPKVVDGNSLIFCEVMDTDGNTFIVSLNHKQHEQYTDIVKYTDNLKNGLIPSEKAAPDPVRLLGAATTYLAVDAKHMAEAYHVTTDEFEKTFGTTYLDTKLTGKRDTSLILAITLNFGSFAFIIGANAGILIYIRHNARRRLEEIGELENAELEFVCPDNLIFEKQGVVISEHFMYCKRQGVAVHCREIVWIYCRDISSSFIRKKLTLFVGMLNGRTIQVASNRMTNEFKEFLNQVANTIRAKNNDILFGLTPQNRKEYRARVKAAKAAGR